MDDWTNCFRDGFFISEEIGYINNEQESEARYYKIYGPEPSDLGENREVGSISVIFNYKDLNLYILGLDTEEDFRGMGVGTFLLRYVALIGSNMRPPIQTINLDDMSDRSTEKIGNIYIKLGMKPETVLDQPEREGLIVDVQSSAGWRNFCSHYIRNKARVNIVFKESDECPCVNYPTN